MKTLLFLCTGNYYRSRFAEEVFNHHAELRKLDWRSDSAGLQVKETRHENVGTFSIHARDGLHEIAINPQTSDREPRDADEDDFEKADLVIAMSRKEHTAMVTAKFPQHLDTVEFWEVEDIEFESPSVALNLLHKLILALVDRLSKTKPVAN